MLLLQLYHIILRSTFDLILRVLIPYLGPYEALLGARGAGGGPFIRGTPAGVTVGAIGSSTGSAPCHPTTLLALVPENLAKSYSMTIPPHAPYFVLPTAAAPQNKKKTPRGPSSSVLPTAAAPQNSKQKSRRTIPFRPSHGSGTAE